MHARAFSERIAATRRRLARVSSTSQERVTELLDELTRLESIGPNDARAERGLHHIEELLATLEEDSSRFDTRRG